MDIFLGLGSNLGDRRANLAAAVQALTNHDIDVREVSPVIESTALLAPGADPAWNRPYLNAVVRCRSALTPDELLTHIKRIEVAHGRVLDGPRWAPRPIDIDILLFGDTRLTSERLRIPHPGLTERDFVLSPLAAIAPDLELDVAGKRVTVLEIARQRGPRIPLWMGILNVTPDSFSDGGELLDVQQFDARVDAMLAAGTQILDLGAEATRPGATALTAEAEWQRLERPLLHLLERMQHEPLTPRISIDTYHVENARRALALGVDIINDVTGLTQPDMLELAADSDKAFIAMHSLTVPVERGVTLPPDADPAAVLRAWTAARIEQWQAAGIPLRRIALDPGIGFGKTALQDLALLRDVAAWTPKALRVLVGHSRKSFQRGFAAPDQAERDLVTLGASLNLCSQGVDILRVHNTPAHIAAYRGWAHLMRP